MEETAELNETQREIEAALAGRVDAEGEAGVGLGRIVTLHYCCPSTSYQAHYNTFPYL